MIVKKCLVCGKEFKIKLYRKNTAKFCSYNCSGKYASQNPNSGSFKVGHPDFVKRKGIKFSNEWKENMRKSHLGQKAWNKGGKNPKISGEKSHWWKGGKIEQRGYIFIYYPNHPFCVNKNHKPYIPEHRLIAEKCLGRYLLKGERIHHINEIKNDNQPKNLYLFPSIGKHNGFHLLKNKPILQSNII